MNMIIILECDLIERKGIRGGARVDVGSSPHRSESKENFKPSKRSPLPAK